MYPYIYIYIYIHGYIRVLTNKNNIYRKPNWPLLVTQVSFSCERSTLEFCIMSSEILAIGSLMCSLTVSNPLSLLTSRIHS